MPSLADIPASRVWQMQQQAAMRMQLYTLGAVQKLMADFQTQATDLIHRVGSANDPLSVLQMHRLIGELDPLWKRTFTTYKRLLMALRRESASLPFGSLLILHNDLVAPVAAKHRQRNESRELDESGPADDFLFDPQLQSLLDVTSRRIYGDGLNLSSRIWKLDEESRQGINAVLYNGVANQRSAWDVAKSLEKYLGANADCPRWTSYRLNVVPKTEIAKGDTTGLYTGSDCESQGVSYNALRLARNEIQTVHAAATDEIMGKLPWVEEEQIYLSNAHPEKDECDDVVNGGRDGEGIYPVGTIKLPIHVHCSPPGQAVQTPVGKKLIEEVKEGDRVLTHRGQYRQVVATMTRHFKGDLIRLRTASGKQVLLTPEHPVMVNGKWKKISEVQLGDSVEVV